LSNSGDDLELKKSILDDLEKINKTIVERTLASTIKYEVSSPHLIEIYLVMEKNGINFRADYNDLCWQKPSSLPNIWPQQSVGIEGSKNNPIKIEDSTADSKRVRGSESIVRSLSPKSSLQLEWKPSNKRSFSSSHSTPLNKNNLIKHNIYKELNKFIETVL